jgi:hypothetical protein
VISAKRHAKFAFFFALDGNRTKYGSIPEIQHNSIEK